MNFKELRDKLIEAEKKRLCETNETENQIDGVCVDEDGCPKETAVLKREWRLRGDNIKKLEAERNELKALIENHRLCEKEPIAWRFDKGPITKLDVWPHGGNWEPLYREALATEPKP